MIDKVCGLTVRQEHVCGVICPTCGPQSQPHTASLTISDLCKALGLHGVVLKYSRLYQSLHVHHTIKPVCACYFVLFSPLLPPTNSSPCWIPALLLHLPLNPLASPCPWLSGSVGLGHSPVVRPALNAGLLPPNYQLQGSASTPGAGQAGNELSPLGWTSGWAVYGGGWALPSGGVNGPSRGTVSRRIHQSVW